MKGVRGETTVHGTFEIEIKIGLMNNMGNLTKKESTIMVEGMSVGGEERIIPKQANAKHPSSMAPPRTTGATRFNPIIKLIITGTVEIIIPKKRDAQISPNKSVISLIGVVTNRSRVLAMVSQGKTAGPTELAVNIRIIPSNPEMTYKGSTVRFMV